MRTGITHFARSGAGRDEFGEPIWFIIVPNAAGNLRTFLMTHNFPDWRLSAIIGHARRVAVPLITCEAYNRLYEQRFGSH